MDGSPEIFVADSAKGYNFWYSDQISEFESNCIIIDDRGNVTANMAHTQNGMIPRSLGWYYLELGHDDSDLATIGSLIRGEKLIGGKVYMIPPIAGMRTKIFVIKADGQETHHILNALEELPIIFVELEQSVLRLFNRLGTAPLRTLSLNVQLEPTRVVPGDTLKVYFEFRCSGKFPLEFRNPSYSEETLGGSLKINLWKKRIDRDGEHLDFETTLKYTDKEFLLEEKKAVPSNEMFLRIPAGGKLLMWTTIQVPKLNPDNYLVETVYYGRPLPPSEQVKQYELIAGEYHADLKQLIVLKK